MKFTPSKLIMPLASLSVVGFAGAVIIGSSARSSITRSVAPEARKSSVHVPVKKPTPETTLKAYIPKANISPLVIPVEPPEALNC